MKNNISKKQVVKLGNSLADDMGWGKKSRVRKSFIKIALNYVDNDSETTIQEMLGFYSGLLAVGLKFKKFGSYRF